MGESRPSGRGRWQSGAVGHRRRRRIIIYYTSARARKILPPPPASPLPVSPPTTNRAHSHTHIRIITITRAFLHPSARCLCQTNSVLCGARRLCRRDGRGFFIVVLLLLLLFFCLCLFLRVRLGKQNEYKKRFRLSVRLRFDHPRGEPNARFISAVRVLSYYI